MDQKANGVENLANLGEGLRGIRLFPGWLSSGLAARNRPMRRMGDGNIVRAAIAASASPGTTM